LLSKEFFFFWWRSSLVHFGKKCNNSCMIDTHVHNVQMAYSLDFFCLLPSCQFNTRTGLAWNRPDMA
jgi:hypothetical protein